MPNSTLVKKDSEMKTESEFEIYLAKRRLNTTYNGIELDSEDWHNKMFGKRSENQFLNY